ncbi:unnamed protein product [Notodromas monacha]|uniref:Target of Myb protein 1 n=1 Tax=Notodromas monacha TaxID=399045 RepID=A0A7R9BCV9_9CRUS|nr:unnamed protein product [Notodromas monacha]CAG0912448.1 unnamed protein product [Notodromas monacha]
MAMAAISSSIMEVIGGNPFGTIIGQKVEQATDPSLASENWGMFMEICDLVNSSEDGPRDAMRAIRKRLQSFVGRNYSSIIYALTLLETCVKNCGHRFHVVACSRDSVQDLVKIIGPKYDPPQVVQEKVLGLIQAWAEAFRTQPDLQGVVQMYNDLRAKGVQFPPTDLDSMAPIRTPPRLDIVECNVKVMREMLGDLVPGEEHPEDAELLQDLFVTVREMQQRVVALISNVSHDDLVADLLRINDDLNTVFLAYGKYKRARASKSNNDGNNHHQQQQKKQAIGGGESLIEFDEQKLASDVGALGVGGHDAPSETAGDSVEDSEFDMFAQSRSSSSKNRGASYEDNINIETAPRSLGETAQTRLLPRDDHLAWLVGSELWPCGMSLNWCWRCVTLMRYILCISDSVMNNDDDEQPGHEGMTSSEFDEFLAERASAGPGSTASATNRTRLAADKRHEEDGMFGL